MPLIVRFCGRRVTKTRRRQGWIWVRLAAVPKEDLLPQWTRLTPAQYRAGRTSDYQPTVVYGRIGEPRDRNR